MQIMKCLQGRTGRPNWGRFVLSPPLKHTHTHTHCLNLKQIPSDLFLKWMGLSLPKRTRQNTKGEGWENHPPTHTHTSHHTHSHTIWKNTSRQDERGVDGMEGVIDFHAAPKRIPLEAPDNVRVRKVKRKEKRNEKRGHWETERKRE